jgi:serine/threonine-protein kinase
MRRPPPSGIVSGAVVGAKYRLLHKIGEGAMGEVWSAIHVVLGHALTIKLISKVELQSPEACVRFEREARTGAMLGTMTDHVAAIFDSGFDPRGPFIAMELLVGESLAQHLAGRRRLSPRKVASFLAQIARALRKAHTAGVVHRDIKPENVFIARHPGEEERVKILDWGIAKILPPGGGPAQTLVAGTPHYMSPEMVEGRPIDTRADLWSLAVMLYRMISGRMPFVGGDCAAVMHAVLAGDVVPPSRVVSRLGPAMDAFFARALARDISARFQTIDELEGAFAAASRPPTSGTASSLPGCPPAPSVAPFPSAANDSLLGYAPTELMLTLRSLVAS